ncbi:hypothetical protein AAF712_016633 [Marasmius tenuissimus]|uniref:Uncharacterized protein n=1 Tax=Marasmius tenuissimus TaxID=585030 RepID=A0ABR2Z8E4_9AGAR
MPAHVKDSSCRPKFAIVKPAIFPRIRRRGKEGKQGKSNRPPLTDEQKKKMKDGRLEKEKKEKAMEEWLAKVEAKAASLGEDFGNDAEYWLMPLYQNGKRMIKVKSKPNSFNTYKLIVSRSGKKKTLMEITEDHTEIYKKLTAAEKAKHVEDFEEVQEKENLPLVTRPSGKSQAQDIAHIIANIEAMFELLRHQIGIDGFFLIVRNCADGIMDPYWYFTWPEVEEYMLLAVKPKWSLEEVSAKIEGFCIAGCDTSTEVSGCPNPKVHYEDIDQMLTKKEGIVIENWPYPRFANLSHISSALPGLFDLQDKVRSGHIHFRKTSKEEHKKWLEEEDKGPKEQKPRCDAGKKRNKPDDEDNNEVQEVQDEDNLMVIDDKEEDELAPTSSRPKGGSKASSKNGAGEKPLKEKPLKEKRKELKNKVSKSLKSNMAVAKEPAKKKQKRKADTTVSSLTFESDTTMTPGPIPSSSTSVPLPITDPSFLPVPNDPAPFNFAPPTSFAHDLNNPTVWNLALCMAQGKIVTFSELEEYL